MIQRGFSIFTIAIASGIILTGCKKDNTAAGNQPSPCQGVNISLTAKITNVTPCNNTGGILIQASGASGLTYSIDNGQTFQSSAQFSGLPAGAYSLVVKSLDGCTATGSATIGNASKGPKMTAVQNLIVSKCYNCHNTGGLAFSDANLSNACAIISKWDRIKARAVDNTPTPMPYVPLQSSDKAIITDWIDSGHGYEN